MRFNESGPATLSLNTFHTFVSLRHPDNTDVIVRAIRGLAGPLLRQTTKLPYRFIHRRVHRTREVQAADEIGRW